MVVSTGGNTHEVRQSLLSGARHILYHTTCWRSGGQYFLWPRCYRQEALKNHRRDHSRKSHWKAVCLSRRQDFGRHRPRIGYNEHRKRLGNEERGGRKDIAQNGQGWRLFGDVAGQQKPMCYPEGISRSKQPGDRSGINLGHERDHQSIVVTLSTWWCGCI